MPPWMAATPNPCRSPFGVACGPLTPAAFITSSTFFQAVVRPATWVSPEIELTRELWVMAASRLGFSS